jgi:hypothetical protein
MDYIKGIEIISTILTLIGITLISIPKRIGMWILLVATIFWTSFAYLTNHNYFLLQNIYIFCFDVIALINWNRKGIGE